MKKGYRGHDGRLHAMYRTLRSGYFSSLDYALRCRQDSMRMLIMLADSNDDSLGGRHKKPEGRQDRDSTIGPRGEEEE